MSERKLKTPEIAASWMLFSNRRFLAVNPPVYFGGLIPFSQIFAIVQILIIITTNCKNKQSLSLSKIEDLVMPIFLLPDPTQFLVVIIWWTRKKSDSAGMSFRPKGEILYFQCVTDQRFLALLEMTSLRNFLRIHQFD